MHSPAQSRPRPVRRSIAVLSALGIAGIGLTALPAGASVDDDGNVVIDLVGINDFHGRISTLDSNGAVALASAVETVRAANEDTVFVSAGDNFGASTFTSMINDDVPTLAILNELDLAVSALGNHEFDQGLDTLWDRIDGRAAAEDEPAWPALTFPYLGANVEAPGDRQFEDYYLHDVVNPSGDPVTVGFVGILTEDMPSLVSPSGIEGMGFTDMTEAAVRVADQLTDGDDANGEADVVVVLVHEGAATEAAVSDPATNFGAFVEGVAASGNVDAVFSGHTHVAYEVDVERGEDLTAMPVIQTGAFSDALGQITLTYDPGAGAVVAADTGLVDLEDYEALVGNEVVDAVAAIVADAEDAADLLGEVPVGTVDRDLNRAVQSDGQENRGGESTIGNLIADAQLWALGEQFPDDPAQIAFMNPGGIRANITGDDDGVVTYRQVATAQPFGNTLVTLDLTGAQVVQVLEEQWQPDGSSRPFLKLGVNEGLFYLYDPQAPQGERVDNVWLGGEPLDPTATYRVVTNSFLASGGDNFTTLGEGENVADSGLIDLAAFVDYFAEHEPVIAPTVQRAVGAHWVSDRTAAYVPGDEIAVDLSSLVFSTDEPTPEELVLELYNEETGEVVDLGTVAVDASVVDTTDEAGRAEVRVTVPQIDGLGDPAVWQLQATDEVNEYFLWFGVYLAAEAQEPSPTPTEEPTTPAPTTPAPTTPAPTTPGGDLPSTGAETSAPLIGGALLVLLGAALVAAVRRRSLTAQ